jgi:hypothetical protein
MDFANTTAKQAIDVAPKPAKKEAASVKKQATPVKKAPKRAARTEKSRPTKRQKKEATPSGEEDEEPTETSEEDEETTISEFDGSDISDAPKSMKKTDSKPETKFKAKAKAKAPASRQKKKVESDEEDTSELLSDIEVSDVPSIPSKKATKSKAPKKRKSRDKIVDSDEDSEDEKPAKKKAKNNKLNTKNTLVESEDEPEEVKTQQINGEQFAKKVTASGTKRYKAKELVIVSDSEESEEEFETKEDAAGTEKYKAKQLIVQSDSESEDEFAIRDSAAARKYKAAPPPQLPVKSPSKSPSPLGPAIWSPGDTTPNTRTTKKKVDNSDDQDLNAPHDDSESEMSVVLDPEPKPKKQKTAKQPKSRQPQSGNLETPQAPQGPPKPELTADEQLIKTLQSQLLKCGVRKIWQFELKKFDGDKAKIRHLQGMLKDIGMTGRFSEQRAKEIKELRELQADLEAVKEGDKAWGLESGRRSRGGPRKSLKESSPDDEDEEGGGAVEDKLDKAAKAKQELAFLGDEESDSD